MVSEARLLHRYSSIRACRTSRQRWFGSFYTTYPTFWEVVHSGPMVPQRGLRSTPLVVLVVWRVSSMETGAWKTQEEQVRALLWVDTRSLGPRLREPQYRRGRILAHWSLWFSAPNNIYSREINMEVQ